MDLQKFLGAKFAPRTAEVQVPELGEWFGSDKPVWVVRGLTGAELARSREAGDRAQSMRVLVQALSGDGDKAKALQDAMGLSADEVPADVSRRIEMLAAGSVTPVLGDDNRDVAVKLAETFPITFYSLTNKIQELTGLGSDPGKRKSSGATQASD